MYTCLITRKIASTHPGVEFREDLPPEPEVGAPAHPTKKWRLWEAIEKM